MGCTSSYQTPKGGSITRTKSLSVQLLRRSSTGTSDGITNSRKVDDYIRRPAINFKRRSSLQQKKEFELYTNLFTSKLQQSNFETLNKEYSDFLINSWIQHLSVSCNPRRNDEDQDDEVPSPICNTVRQLFDHLIYHTLRAKPLVVDELYHTIFSDYDLDLKHDGHNKVACVNQLKTRGSPSTLVTDKDVKAIPNPYLSIPLMKDWLLLVFWSLFLENRASPPVSKKFSDFFSISSSKKTIRTVDKEQTPVLPFDPLLIEERSMIKPLSESTQKGMWIFPRPFKSEKVAITSEHLSEKVENDKNHDLTPKEARKKSTLLKYSDLVGINVKSNEPEFVKYILSGSWLNPVCFFSSLEQLNQAICIFSVERNGTYFPHIYVNKYWEGMTGYSREEILGDDITMLMGNNTEESQSRRLGSCMKDGLRLKIGINLVKADGKDMYCLLSMIPVVDIKKNYKFMVMKLYDVEGSTATICDLKYSDEVLLLIALALRSF